MFGISEKYTYLCGVELAPALFSAAHKRELPFLRADEGNDIQRCAKRNNPTRMAFLLNLAQMKKNILIAYSGGATAAQSAAGKSMEGQCYGKR